MTSLLAQAKADILYEFGLITVANGYSTTPERVIEAIRHPNDVDVPSGGYEIGIEFGVEVMKPFDASWVVFTSSLPVMVVAIVRCDTDLGNEAVKLEAAAELIRWDIKRVMARILRRYISSSNGPWFVSPKTKDIEVGPLGGEGIKRNIAAIGTTFDIVLRNQESPFRVGQVLLESGDDWLLETGDKYLL